MKRWILGCLITILCFALSSCDEAQEIADIDFDRTITKSLLVSVSNTNEMTASVILDAATDAEISKYVDKIKKYEILEILFAVENYTTTAEEEIYFNGNIGFSKHLENQPTSVCSLSPYNITHVASTGDAQISTCNMIIDEISGLLISNNAVKIYMLGSFTKSPLSFDLKVTIKVKVTASPL